MPKNKNIILFIGPYIPMCFQAVEDLQKHFGEKFRVAFLMSKNVKDKSDMEKKADYVFRVDIKNMRGVEKALAPIKDKVVAVVCRSEFYMPFYAKIISLFPHLRMPTRDSIEWCANKLMMRRKFLRYFPKINPKFTLVRGFDKDDIKKVKIRVGFPCIVKPASLAASRLVAVCYHEEELQSTLRKTYRGINRAYKEAQSHVEPEVIVEQFMEGEMYSIDAYIDYYGNVKHLPAVHVKTGQNIGVDDFYNYRVLTPTRMNKETEKEAQDVANKALYALGLRACMVHMEFIHMDDVWKVLEVGARMGGHRDLMYREAYGIPHGMNDILTRMGEKPVLKKKRNKYVASFNIFPRKTGFITSIKGIKKVKALKSLSEFVMVKKVGDKAGLSKDGFKKVLDITLANKSREDLFADIRRMEKSISIELDGIKQ